MSGELPGGAPTTRRNRDRAAATGTADRTELEGSDLSENYPPELDEAGIREQEPLLDERERGLRTLRNDAVLGQRDSK
jgi:hypothetical protein